MLERSIIMCIRTFKLMNIAIMILSAATKKNGKYIGNCVKILDKSGLKLSVLNQIKLLTTISTVDDLNYLEKTITYYIVNVPYVFLASWKMEAMLLLCSSNIVSSKSKGNNETTFE